MIKSLGEKIRVYARNYQIPASLLKIQQCSYLFIGKDLSAYHIVFVDIPGQTQVEYRDLSKYGSLETGAIFQQIRIEIGDVLWGFSFPSNMPDNELEKTIQDMASSYVRSILTAQLKPKNNVSARSNLLLDEIASGLEKFKKDYSDGKKVAFIIMQFGNTKPHNAIVDCI